MKLNYRGIHTIIQGDNIYIYSDGTNETLLLIKSGILYRINFENKNNDMDFFDKLIKAESQETIQYSFVETICEAKKLTTNTFVEIANKYI